MKGKVQSISAIFALTFLGGISGAVVGYLLGVVIFGSIAKQVKAQDPDNPLDLLAMLALSLWFLCSFAGAVAGLMWGIIAYAEHRQNGTP